MTIRKTPEQIKKEILDFLFEGPKSISEIATKISSNWPTTNSYLDKLKDEKKVNEILSTDKMKIYRRMDDPIYYSLPFSKEIRMRTLYLLSEIQKIWREKKGEELSKTALQKIAVDVIKTYNLDLPILEFHYGMTTCASFDYNNKDILSLIEVPNDKEKILMWIKKIIESEEHTGKAYQERIHQYKKYDMPFYYAKENLTRLFILHDKNKSDKEFKQKLKKALLDLSLNYPIKLEKFYFEFERFLRDVQIILSNGSNDEIDKLEVIKETLTQLWDKLTTFTSFINSERFIEVDKKQLFEQIKELNLNFKEMNYKEYIEVLESIAQEINPFKIKMPENDFSNEIQGMIVEGLENE